MKTQDHSHSTALTLIVFRDPLHSRTFHIPLSWLSRLGLLLGFLLLFSLVGITLSFKVLFFSPLPLPPIADPVSYSKQNISSFSPLLESNLLPSFFPNGWKTAPKKLQYTIQKESFLPKKPHWQFTFLVTPPHPTESTASTPSLSETIPLKGFILLSTRDTIWTVPSTVVSTEPTEFFLPAQGKSFLINPHPQSQELSFEIEGEAPSQLLSLVLKEGTDREKKQERSIPQARLQVFLFHPDHQLVGYSELSSSHWSLNSYEE